MDKTTLIKLSPSTVSSFKYVYIIIFFALLSGLFYPIINNFGYDQLIQGVATLILGLVGGILIYRSSTNKSSRFLFLCIGLGMIGLSLAMIYGLIGAI